jgi:hypothetical protein
MALLLILTGVAIVACILAAKKPKDRPDGNNLHLGLVAVLLVSVILMVFGLLPVGLWILIMVLLFVTAVVWLLVPKPLAIVLGALGVLVALMFCVGLVQLGGASNASADTGGSGSSASSTSSSIPATSSANCAGGHTVKLLDTTGNDLNHDGANQRGEGSEPAFKQQIIDQAAVNPQTLLNYYAVSPAWDSDPLPSASDPSSLVVGGVVKDGVCYSQLGIAAYDRWLPLWKSATLTYKTSVTHQGENTGVENGNVVQSSGVSGADKEGVDVSYDGDHHHHDHSALYRCTQVTTGQPNANVPQGHTDNTEAPSATTTSAAATTPAATTTSQTSHTTHASSPTSTRTTTSSSSAAPTSGSKVAALTPSPTGGGNATGTTSVPPRQTTPPAQPTLTSPPTEVQNPSPTSSSPPVSGDPGGA